MREKLLIRQIEAIFLQTSKQPKNINGKVEFKIEPEEEESLLTAIRCFGKFKLDNMNLQDIFLKNEDYILENEDHETMYKQLEDTEENAEAIVVDFSQHNNINLIDQKAHPQSIVNITLQEAKELIRKAKAKKDIPPLNLEEMADELESSIADAVSAATGNGAGSISHDKSSAGLTGSAAKKSKSKKFKPKITINNCNGTINLRNISSLTINCASEEGVSAQIPLPPLHSEANTAANAQGNESDDQSTQYLPFAKNCKSSKHSKSSNKSASEVTSTTSNSSSSTLVSDTAANAVETNTDNSTASSSNYSSNASSRSQSKKHKNKKSQPTPTHNRYARSEAPPLHDSDYEEENSVDEQATAATCDFYNRLLNEIKNSLKTKHGSNYDNAHYFRQGTTANTTQKAAADSTCDANSNISSCTASTVTSSCSTAAPSIGSQKGKRLILKNFENLKIILEANDEDSLQPVQIEQWLAEIISETDQEPLQSTDILEHSKIHSESSN